MRKDGGAAFPDEINEGMSLRDYFAAHAPSEIPEWFECPGVGEIHGLGDHHLDALTYMPPRPAPPEPIHEPAMQWLTDDAGCDLESFLAEAAPAEHIELA